MTHIVEQMYLRYAEASGRVHVDHDLVRTLEAKLCDALRTEPNGRLQLGLVAYVRVEVRIGPQLFVYFSRLSTEHNERRDPLSDGYSFGRRATDIEPVIPEAAIRVPHRKLPLVNSAV
jgi:hypothetical protein